MALNTARVLRCRWHHLNARGICMEMGHVMEHQLDAAVTDNLAAMPFEVY